MDKFCSLLENSEENCHPFVALNSNKRVHLDHLLHKGNKSFRVIQSKTELKSNCHNVFKEGIYTGWHSIWLN